MYALFKIKSPDASQKLTIKSLPAIGADGQRTGDRQHINGDGLYSVTVSTPILAMPDSIYYVAVIQGVKLSDLSFETESWEEGTGSIKGIPTSVLQNQAKILNKEYNEYNVVASGTAYTIDGNNWHEYVEIDGRKWATMNVGATSPEQQGYYFSWGNTEGHWLNGTDDGYVFGESQYESTTGSDVVTDITGNVNYDAASANWGGAWRMPAIEELRTLISLTTKEPVTDYNSTGMAGYIFSDGGNSLFFPKAIAVCENEWCDDGGYYWSSTYNPLSVGFSPCLYFYSGCMEDSYDRYLGIPVRAIIDDPDVVTPAPEEVATDLSSSETANCYIVNAAGAYKFKAVKGNSNESVGTPKSAEVLWESYGTSTAPNVKDLVSKVSLENGYVKFTATDKKGNAVIAVKDENKNILWSWHIWLTDEPEDQVYANDAGTMMDRNLGATSNNGSDEDNKLASFGLLYQWGRKDPFLGGDGVKSTTRAASTLSWPEAEGGHKTVDWAIQNPTTFITSSENPLDWTNPRNDELWKSDKTIYDPCPSGYRVPDGGDGGVWKTAGFSNETRGKFVDGFNFSTLSGGGTTWYPAASRRSREDGTLSQWQNGNYWSCSSNDKMQADLLYFRDVEVNSVNSFGRACGNSVRCQKIVEE